VSSILFLDVEEFVDGTRAVVGPSAGYGRRRRIVI
jgi:hypothetical protein